MWLIKKFYRYIFAFNIVAIGLIMFIVIGIKATTARFIVNILIAYFLSPKIKKIEGESIEKIQLKWIFSDKIISIDN